VFVSKKVSKLEAVYSEKNQQISTDDNVTKYRKKGTGNNKTMTIDWNNISYRFKIEKIKDVQTYNIIV